VFGVNDGLISNASLILGVAGASADNQMILLAGAAGLVAGAFSMAAGEYVSVRSQREMYEYQIGLEREELEHYPDAEAEELALIYERADWIVTVRITRASVAKKASPRSRAKSSV
jgi:VIT1/CCC1 family predicted Fe2+/Mn2+ transporter